MPTKKRRVGFIPRSEVLDLIDKLSYENNLSYSKIINILVEEALHKRGMLSKLYDSKVVGNDRNFTGKEKVEIVNNKVKSKFQNKLFKDEILDINEANQELFDNEIYDKFLMFLHFKERMKKGI